MSTTGEMNHPRPRISIAGGSPSSAELAATVLAIERLLAEDAAASAVAPNPGSRWQRAALLEGVAAKQGLGAQWRTPPRAANG